MTCGTRSVGSVAGTETTCWLSCPGATEGRLDEEAVTHWNGWTVFEANGHSVPDNTAERFHQPASRANTLATREPLKFEQNSKPRLAAASPDRESSWHQRG
jgi:hypothetical protein